jgi:hypothetical protein
VRPKDETRIERAIDFCFRVAVHPQSQRPLRGRKVLSLHGSKPSHKIGRLAVSRTIDELIA